MKRTVVGIFKSIEVAGKFIDHLRRDLQISSDNISYVYRNHEGEVKEVGGDTTAVEGATAGAIVGGSLGALAGIATVAGLIPVIGPIFAAGPIIAALGLGSGAIATTAAGAITGAVTGGVIGALVSLGAPEVEAQEYEESVRTGDVLVIVQTENESAVTSAFASQGATSVRSYSPKTEQ